MCLYICDCFGRVVGRVGCGFVGGYIRVGSWTLEAGSSTLELGARRCQLACMMTGPRGCVLYICSARFGAVWYCCTVVGVSWLSS